MKILFLHGWTSVPGGTKPTFLKDHGHEVFNPTLPDEDFEEAVRIAQAEFDQHHPDVIVGSSRGGAVAMNIDSQDTPLVLLCPAWKKWGTATTVKPNTVILHSRQDDVVPFADSEELVKTSCLPESALIEIGTDHRLADEGSLEAMVRAAIDACVPELTDDPSEMLQQEWSGLCYTAAKRWVSPEENADWVLVHGTVLSERVGKRVNHAWCERGDQIVDLTLPVSMRSIEREEYYRITQPEVSKRYSSEETLLLSIKNRHDGPWDESEQLPPEEGSILDHPAISGRYLFPQPRFVSNPFMVDVNSVELACYRKIVDPDGFTMVHFHGNGESVADYVPDIAELFADFGLNSLFVEYREYGGSTGQAQLVAMLGDGEAVIKAAGLAPEKVIVFGRSIGSLYAIELVDRQPTIAGLIIESGIADPSERFLTYADLDSARIEEADVLAEVELCFNHQMKLMAYKNPLLILHTEDDGLIDISHAERNYEWAGSTVKEFVRLPFGNHNTILSANLKKYLDAVRNFVEGIQS